MSDLEQIFELANLRRAYRWVLSNTDTYYKSFFRDSYAAYALCSDTALKRLRADGLHGRYEPTHASKVMVPKPSGTLRPITLLTVEDQLIYQACVNVVSELLKPITKQRYRKRVFAHLYAGKSSEFFYLKWQDSYRLLGRHIREYHGNGFKYLANFDLAAFYDSIDHQVLSHYLLEVGLDEDAKDFLLRCLRRWTSNTWSTGPTVIYHGHGIPQGPLASGMLSEVVLQHIDGAGERGRRTKYLRYVDDIKIMAKTEDELRRKLIALDLAAKEIGLFPQTAKINLRLITNPDDEIKSISRPPEPSLTPKVNHERLHKRLMELTRRSKVDPKLSTRMKYLLVNAKPNSRLSLRVVSLIRRHPELSSAAARYLEKQDRIPSSVAMAILRYLDASELYHSVNADLLRACLGRLATKDADKFSLYSITRLLRPPANSLRLQPTFKEALIAWSLREKRLTFNEFEHLLGSEKDWWIRKSSIRELVETQFGKAGYRSILNRFARTCDSELSRCSAARIVTDGVVVDRPHGSIFNAAKVLLKAVGVIRVVGRPPSLINSILAYVLRTPASQYDWVKLFGRDHRHAEQMAIILKQKRETDIDAFLVGLDSFCDKLMKVLFERVAPGVDYKYVSALKHPKTIDTLPLVSAAFLKLHDLRLQSVTAHPRSYKTGADTRRLKHRDYHQHRPDVVAALAEIERVIVL